MPSLSWRQPLDRGPYAAAGLGLFAVKYLADRFLSEVVYGRPWALWSYLDPTGAGRIATATPETAEYAVALAALAVPFIAVGTLLTVRRLRSAGLPPWWVPLFFVPVVNLLFFVALSVIPARDRTPGLDAPTWLEQVVPEGRTGAAALAVGVTGVGALALVWLAAEGLGSYGAGLFLGVPFVLGMVAAVLYGVHGPRSLGESVGVALSAVALTGALLAVLMIEGVICLVMAAPIALALAAVGAGFGHALSRMGPGAGRQPALWAVGVVPLLVAGEAAAPPVLPLLPVTTAVTVDAPPDVVWEHVVSFSELPPPSDWALRTGIAYPIRATIDGAGVGAVRRCEFTTGAFVEPITVWEPGRRLAFSVREQPSPMRERGVFGEIDAHHLNGYFVSERGQFLLTALPGGRTRLEGTTWYRHRIGPTAYWRLWSDAVLHRIHGRVLRHVAALAEG